MAKRKVGPLPLLGGLQTQPAEGKPTGLLRCLNMEVRDGLLSTRRGQVELPAVFLRLGDTLACDGSPANPSVGTTLFIGIPASFSGREDSVASLTFTANTREPFVDTTYTFEFFGEDDLWHAMSVHNATPRLTGFWSPNIADGFSLWAEFVVPHGWKTAQPSGLPSSAKWIRITKSSNWTVTSSVPVAINGEAPNIATALIAPTTRSGSGPFALTTILDQIVNKIVYDVIDVTAKPTGTIPFYTELATAQSGYLNTLNASAGTRHLVDGAPVWMLYIPYTDVILVHAGGVYSQIDPAKAPGDALAAAVFAPDIDERYEDIACESSLPRSSAAILFGGRIFLLGAGAPARVQWSAPRAFWTTWPSANVADLGGGAGGKLVGAATDDRSLFMFTSSSIWIGVLGDPTAGNESDFFVDIAEETPCASGASIVATPSGVLFLSEDGVRRFDGKRSKLIGAGVRDLFRPDSEHPLACIRKATAVGAFHPIENQYWLSYASPGARHNDTILVYDLDDGTVHLWGMDTVDALGTSGATGPIGQRARGIRAQSLAWSEKLQSMVCATPGIFFTQIGVGADDLEDKTQWYFETHNMRIANAERAVLEEVNVHVLRDSFQTFTVKAIPDGDRARADTRTVAVEPDRLNTASAFGSASLAGQAALQLDASIAPVRARFRKVGRNHRVRIESVAPNHTPIRVLTLQADVSVDEKSR